MSTLRACPVCGGALQPRKAVRDGVECDGHAHTGPRSLRGLPRFSCVADGCDFDCCGGCADGLEPTANMDWITIRMKPQREVSRSEELSLGVGYGQVWSPDGKVAGWGPRQLRDFMHRNCKKREKEAAQAEAALRRVLETTEQKLLKLEQQNLSLKSELSAAREFAELAAAAPDTIERERALIPLRPRTREARAISPYHDKFVSNKRAASDERYNTSTVRKLRAKLGTEQAAHEQTIEKLAAEVDAHGRTMEERDGLQVEIEARDKKLGRQERAWSKPVRELEAKFRAAVKEHERSLVRAEREAAERVQKAELAHAAAEEAAAEECKEVHAQAKASIEQMRVAADVREAALTKEAAAEAAELRERATELEKQINGSRGLKGLASRAEESRAELDGLCKQLGLDTKKLPTSKLNGTHMLYQRNVRFVAAALKDRDPLVIAAAADRNGQIDALLQTAQLQPKIKEVIGTVLSVIQDHWSARMAVILMAEVHTSRSEFDTLRHLLSFIYDRDQDTYGRIKAWINPHNERDFLYVPVLTARGPREAERAKIYGQCGATASADGLYAGVNDLEAAAVSMVEHYWEALNPAVQAGETALMLVLTGDATGGWRGDAVTHGELGIGSWAKGKAQSKLTLLPLFLMEGDDGAVNLRNRCGEVAKSYNALKKKGSLTVTIDGRKVTLPVKLRAAADFQFFKAVMNMSKYTSAIWCTCKLDNLYKRPDEPAKTWADCEAFFDSIGCVMKDLATICELNHYSLEVLQGRAFKPFGCRCGWKSGSEKEWRAAVEAHAQLEGEELKATELAHSGSDNPLHCRHKPYNPPLLHQPSIDNSADVLHLIFINMFAFFMEHTMLIPIFDWEPALRTPFELYLRGIGIPIKCAKAVSVTEMKQCLTGRDAKARPCPRPRSRPRLTSRST